MVISTMENDMECQVGEQADDSKEQSPKDAMLLHISFNNEAHFKSQQLGDPDLTVTEKHDIAEALLNKSSSLFLAKFGKYLLDDHLKYFEGSEDYEVNFYLNELQKGKTKPVTKSQIRNRRLEALKQLTEKGEYFSDIEMKRRNPLLYEELVGQYMTDKEKIDFESEQMAQKSFASIFSNIVEQNLMDTKLKNEIKDDINTMSLNGMDFAMPKTSELWGEIGESSTTEKRRVLDNSRFEDISSNEKAMLVNEFRSRVYADFLGGKDNEFDYSTVDENADYDDLEMLESDQQDSYFDAESPKTVYDEESNESMQP